MKSRFFRFSYLDTGGRNKWLRPHQLRDGGAFGEIAAVLCSNRYIYGGLLCNHPAEDALGIIDSFQLQPSDLLVLTTRPPIDDEEKGDNRGKKRSGTLLEKNIFATCRQYLSICARSQVMVSKSIAAKLSSQNINKAWLEFRQNGGASYTKHTKYNGINWYTPATSNLTMTFLLYTPVMKKWDGKKDFSDREGWENLEDWTEGPGLVVTFGMGGTEGLTWAYLLRTRYPHLLSSPRFVMAQLETQPISKPFFDLSFAHEWKVETIIDEAISSGH